MILIPFVLSILTLSSGLSNPPVITKWRPNLDSNAIHPLIDNPPSTYRLPNDSFPLRYELNIRTGIAQGEFDFYGRVRIQIQTREETDEIVIHSKSQTILNVNLFNEDLTRQDGSNLTTEKIESSQESHDFLVIKLPSPKRAGEIFWLDIQYEAVLRTDGGGFYRGSYRNDQDELVHYATTQFEVTDARHAFPCYDEPGIRAPIYLSLSYQAPFYAVANMPVANVISDEVAGYTRTIFEPTPPMQTYLLAFLISDYKYIEAPSNSTRIPQSIYAIPSRIDQGYAEYAATVVGAVVRELEKYLNFDYPLPKLDHAALTFFVFGAMENFGFITYTESGLLLNPDESYRTRIYRENSIVGLIAHEVAHQWFGNVISPQWWTYTWLNEGFATLFTNFIPNKIYPDRNAYQRNYVRSNLPAAFSTDALASTWAMNHYTETPSLLWNKFGNIGYSKSGCVLRMFLEAMSEETFGKGLHYYLEENNMTAANPDHLHSALQKAYNEDHGIDLRDPVDIGEFMYTWENQPGYPVVTVEFGNNTIGFIQQRKFPYFSGETYAIPLTYSTTSTVNFERRTVMRWLTVYAHFFSLNLINNIKPGEWIILNHQQVGYYRVDYSTEIWHAIIEQLKEDYSVIHPINRAVLQDEIYMGWKNFGRVTAADILSSLLYFDREDEPTSWIKVNNFLTEMRLRLSGMGVQDHFNKMVRDLTKPQVTRLLYDHLVYEPTDITDLRGQLRNWNCYALDEDCLRNEYQKWFDNFIIGTSTTFNYCFALNLLGENLFDNILNQITTNASFPSRGSYFDNLGCMSHLPNLIKLLEASIDAENILTTQNRLAIMRSVFRNSQQGFDAVLYVIDDKYVEISNLIGSDFASLLIDISQYVNPNSLSSFTTLKNKLRTAAFLSEENVATIDENVRVLSLWYDQNYEHIRIWFESYTGPVTTTQAPTTTPITTQSPPSTTSRELSTTTPLPDNSSGSASKSIILLIVGIILSLVARQQ